jgi:hypothetical protein
MGELVESAGHDIAVQLMTEILAEIITSNTGDASTNATVPYADWMPVYSSTNGTVGLTFTKHSSTAGITYAQFLAVIAAVDVGYVKTKLVMTANSGDVLPVSAPTAGVNDIGAKVYDGTTSKYIGVLVGYQPNTAITPASTVMTWIILARQGATVATGHPLTLVRTDGTAGIGVAGAGAATATAYGLRKYGGPDVVNVDPQTFWDLMGILQFTMSLFGDANTDAIQKGVITTKFGCKIIKQSLMPLNSICALNSAKAIGLCFRRNIKVEPINFPSWNEYGIQATIRARAKALYPEAMQVAVGAQIDSS